MKENKIDKIKKIMINKYKNDPLYLAVLTAKSNSEQTIKIDTLKQIRGEQAYNNMKNTFRELMKQV